MDIDALAREVADIRRTLDDAVRDIDRFMRPKSDTVSYLPSAPFVAVGLDWDDMAALLRGKGTKEQRDKLNAATQRTIDRYYAEQNARIDAEIIRALDDENYGA